MKKNFRNIIKLSVVFMMIISTVVNTNYKARAVGIGKTFAEQFPNAHTADVVAEFFGKTASDEIDSSNLNIIELNLTDTMLTDIRGISIFTNLSTISMSNNQITEIPDEIGLLTNLTNIILYENEIERISPEIGNLINLDSIDLEKNKLTSLPSEFGNLVNLTYTSLAHNDLVSLPDTFGNLASLNNIDLEYNNLTSLPSTFGNLSNLVVLDLSNNELTSIPNEFENLTKLSYLNLYVNNLDSIPSIIGNLTQLDTLNLVANNLSTLPDTLQNLRNLRSLFLSENNFTTLPLEATRISSLDTLYLNQNKLTTLPVEIANLTNLRHLHLDDNPISTLPVEIGNLTKLVSVSVFRGELTSLPASIGNLRNVFNFNLSYNELTSLPSSFVNLPKNARINLLNNLLPTNYKEVLNLVGFTSIIIPVGQLKLELSPLSLKEFTVTNENELNNTLDSLTLVTDTILSTSHSFIYDDYRDESNNVIDYSDYILNGNVIKRGTINARVRSTGAGMFPNNSDNAITSEVVTLTLRFPSHNVTFDLNGGTSATPAVQSVEEGQLVSEVLSVPTRAGYNFLGWSTSNTTPTSYWNFASDLMPANDITLYSIWEMIPTNEVPVIIAPIYTEILEGEAVDLLDGVTASDLEDGDLTSSIVVSSDDLDTNTPGIYVVTYSVTDSDSNTVEKKSVVLVNDGTYMYENEYIINAKDFDLPLTKINDSDEKFIEYAKVKVFDLRTYAYIDNPVIIVDRANLTNKVGKYPIKFKYNPEITVTANVYDDSVKTPVYNNGNNPLIKAGSNQSLTFITFIIFSIISILLFRKKKQLNK